MKPKKITYDDLMALSPCEDSLPFISQELNCSALGFLKYTQRVKGFKPDWALWVVLRPEYLNIDIVKTFTLNCAEQAARAARYASYAASYDASYARDASDAASDASDAARYANAAARYARDASAASDASDASDAASDAARYASDASDAARYANAARYASDASDARYTASYARDEQVKFLIELLEEEKAAANNS